MFKNQKEVKAAFKAKHGKHFSRMSRAEQRVAIAKDALDQIKAGIFIAEQGTYVDINFENYQAEGEVNLELLNKKAECNVCQLGSLFLSEVCINNNLNISTVHSGDTSGRGFLRKRLIKYFTDAQLDLIETAFEGEVIYDNTRSLQYYDKHNIVLTDLGAKAIKYCQGMANDRNRQIKILNNIIKNNGTFVV